MNDHPIFRILVLGFVAGSAACAAWGGGGATAGEGRGDGAEVWLCTGKVDELIADDAQWDFVKQHLDGLKIYIAYANNAPMEKLQKLVKVLEENDIQLAIECGGTLGHVPLDENNGLESARRELKAISRIYEAGGKVDFLDMDGPVSRLLKTGRHRYEEGFSERAFDSIDDCLDQLVIYMQTVREAHPNIEFFALTNFPNWGYKGDVSYHARHENSQDWGDYFEVVSRMIPRTNAAGIPLVGLTVDNPWDYTIGIHESVNLEDPTTVDWVARIRDLEDYVKSHGLEFNLIVNDQVGSMSSAADFRENSLAYLEKYQAAGGAAKRWIVQSWNKFPERATPETDPDSITAVTKEFIVRVKGVQP